MLGCTALASQFGMQAFGMWARAPAFTVRTGNILSRATLGGRSEGSNPRPRKRSEASLIGVRRTTCARRLQPGRGAVLGNQRLQRRLCFPALGLLSGDPARRMAAASSSCSSLALLSPHRTSLVFEPALGAAAGALGGLALAHFLSRPLAEAWDSPRPWRPFSAQPSRPRSP